MSQHPEKWRKNFNPDPTAGQNYGLRGEEAEEDAATAYEYKELHDLLSSWSDADLRQIVIVPEGTQLQQGAVYFDLMDPERGEFKARGDMIAEAGSRLVPKDRTGYDLWNRLTSARIRR